MFVKYKFSFKTSLARSCILFQGSILYWHSIKQMKIYTYISMWFHAVYLLLFINLKTQRTINLINNDSILFFISDHEQYIYCSRTIHERMLVLKTNFYVCILSLKLYHILAFWWVRYIDFWPTKFIPVYTDRRLFSRKSIYLPRTTRVAYHINNIHLKTVTKFLNCTSLTAFQGRPSENKSTKSE